MFSKTIIAASTTMPTAKAIPASEMTLMERPMAAMATNAPTYSLGNLDDQNGWSSTAGPWGANADFGAEGVVSSNPVGGALLTGAADDYSVIGGYSTHALDQTYNNSGTVNITFYAYWDGNPAKTGFDGDERVVQVWPLDGSDVEALVVGNFPRNGKKLLSEVVVEVPIPEPMPEAAL